MVGEAQEVAQSLLAEALPRRWEHVQGVAGKAERVAASLALSGEVLVSAAWLHDIGYAPDVVETGFHPLDGARYLAGLGAPERVVNLVARHSNAILEAELRGIGDLVAVFPDEGGALRDALWYCDLTTSPDGQPVSAPDRIAEIKDAVRAWSHRDPVHYRWGAGTAGRCRAYRIPPSRGADRLTEIWLRFLF